MPLLSAEMIDTLVHNTIAVKTSKPDELDDWRDTLQQSVIFAIQTQRPNEEAFLLALLAIVDDRESKLESNNPYLPHLQEVKDAIAKRMKTNVDYKQLFDTITAMYKYAGAASLRELLRRTGASEEQVEAVIGQMKQLDSDTLLLDDQIEIIVENTIEVKTATPEKLTDWKEKLKQAIVIAEEDGNAAEKSFFEALTAILEDTKVLLTDSNPYYPYLAHILEAIERYGLKGQTSSPQEQLSSEHSSAEPVSEQVQRDDKMSKLPQDMIDTMVKTTIAVKTVANSNLDDWRNNIEKSIQIAAKNERLDDQHFFTALLGVLNDEDVMLPDTSPYQAYLKTIVDGIEQFEAESSEEQQAISSFASIYQDGGETALRERLKKSGASDVQSDAIVNQIMKLNPEPELEPVLPSMLVESMVQTTIKLKTQTPEKLKEWRDELHRNMESAIANKRSSAQEFFGVLLALINEKDVILPQQSPYYVQLQKVKDALLVEGAIQEEIEELTDTVVGGKGTEHDSMPEEAWLAWLEQNTLAVLTVSPEFVEDWKESLQHEMMNSQYPLADPKITFLAALYNLVHNRLPALDALNPYYPNWQNVLVQVSRFKSGRRVNPDFLDKCVLTTIEVCTSNIEGHEAWRQRLRKLHALAVGRKDRQEEDLFRALLDIAEGRLPSVSFDNPYVSELQRVQAEIASYQTQTRKNTDETIESASVVKPTAKPVDKTIYNPRSAKILSLDEPYRSELKGLLDALEVAMGKVSPDNKNDVEIVREEVGRAIDEATKNEPDLKRLKIRADSLRVAAANLQNISPIINQLSALLLRFGE